MAAINIADCTVTILQVSGVKIAEIVTPATADAADTIDVSTLFDTGCFSTVSSSTTLAATNAADKYGDKQVTLPAGATNEAHTIISIGR